jgi:hypothetical protein
MTKKPDFLIGGIQKGGTTSLWYYMRQHPGLFFPEKKELNFFSNFTEQGQGNYLKHFEGCPAGQLAGEASPLYLCDPEVPARIHQMLPEVKLLFTLRDPAARAFSNYWFNLQRGLQDPAQGFSEAIRSTHGIEHYISKGFYEAMLRRYDAFFEPRQMLVLLDTDLRQQLQPTLAKAFEFVGVDSSFQITSVEAQNVTHVASDKKIAGLYFQVRRAGRALRKVAGPKAMSGLTRLHHRLHGKVFKSSEKPVMSAEDRAYLVGLYREDTTQLEGRLGRDLSQWKTA